MTPRRLAVVLLALALPAIGLAALAADAPAHPSDCHAQQSCPADDHSYVWVDESDNGWDCALEGSPEARPEDTTIIAFEGVNFVCQALGPVVATPPVATAPTTTAPPATTPTLPVETIPAPAPARPEPTPIPVTTNPRPKAATPAPVLTTEKPRTARKAAEPTRKGARQRPRRQKPTVSAPPEFLRPVGPPPIIRRDAPSLLPALTADGYVFPVYGPSSFIDTYGAARATVNWHHGTDIFAPLGAPLLAVARGEVFSVGWNDLGGLRLWLRDEAGNEFYYAHLSAFSPLAVNGAHVEAGAVLGFIGNTGDAEGTPYHVHFEIHPVSLLALGYDGVVNPQPYLEAWRRLQDFGIGFRAGLAGSGLLRFNPGIGWVPNVDPSIPAPPEPGAILLQASDISSASGLEPGSLQRALSEATPEEGDGLTEEVGQSLSSEETAARLAALPTPLTRPISETEAAQRLASARKRLETRLRGQAVAHARAAALAATSGPFRSAPWDLLAICESGGNWSTDTGNGYSGGLQFAPGTWIAFGGARFALTAAQAARGEQITVAERVLAAQGWEAWPACSAKLGLR